MEFGGKCLNISDPKIKALADKFGEISVSEAITKWEAMGNDSLPSEDMIQLLDDYAMDIEAGTDPIEANRKLQKNIRQSKTIDSKTRIATDRAIDTNIEKYKRVLAKLSGSKTPTQESQEYQDLLTQTFVKSDVGMMIGDGDAKMDQFKQKLRNIYEKIMVFKNDYEVEKMLTKIATDENFLGKGKGIDQDIQAGIEKLYEDGVAEVNQQKIELAKRLSSFETDKLVSLIFFFKSNRITPYIKFIWNGSKLDKIAFSNANYEVELSNRANEHMKQFTDDQIMKLIKKQINRIDSKPTFESDAKFLEKLTGITVKEWEIYTRHTAKTKEEAAKRGMPSFTPKDKILEYQILKNFSKNHPDAKSFKDALFKTRGKGLGGRINTLAKNATLPEVMENISSRFANTKFNKKSSSQLSSQVIDRIMDMKNNDYSKGYYKDNEFVQFHKGRSPLFAEIDGHYVKSSDQDYKSEEAGSLSDDDLMRTIDHLMDSKITGRESYLQNTGQFGDKDKMLFVEVPLITDLKTIENKYLELLKKQKFKWTDGKNSVTRTLTETEAKAVIANIKAEASKNFTNRGGMSAEVKALNYAYNFNLVNDFINGKIEQYGKPEVGKDGKTYFKTSPLIDMFKRNGSQASPGMIGSKYVEGGLGEGFNHLVISKIKGDNAFALMDGGRFITRAHSEKVKKSYGSIFNFGTVIKAIVSHTDNNGMRFLDKSCGVVIDELAKEFPNSPYAKLFEFMQKHGIDSVSTEDTTKFTGNIKAIKLLDKNGFINNDISTEDLLKNHVRFVETENYRVQQDLTNDGRFYESQVPIQRIKNLMHNSNALKVAEMYNRVSKTRIDNIVDNLRKTNIKQWRSYILGELKFSNSEIETIANEENKEAIEFTSLLESLDDIEKHLANGVPFEHPHVSRWLSTFMANTITKQALGRLTNKVLAVEMPYLPNEDFKLKETKVSNGKVYLPTAAVPYNSKLRTPKKVKSKKEALRLINKYPNSYMDMFTRFKPDGSPAGIHEHEIEVLEDGSAIIPGEFFLFTRIPADAPHSHTLARVAYRLPKEMGNVVITDTVSQQMAGADNDGDQRTIEGFFKEKILNKKGNRIARVNIGEDNAKEMANKAFHMEMQEFYSPEFQKQVLTPIDNGQFDGILDNLPKEKRYPQDSSDAFVDSRKKNNVGLGVVGLSANMQAVYDFLKAHGSFIKIQKTKKTEKEFLPLSLPQLSARNNKIKYYGSLKVANFSTDDKVKAVNGNFLNLALDNVKDPKIERLGLNEVTVKMFLPAMMLKPNGMDEMQHAESVIAFFNTPTVKKYVEKVRESKRLHSKIKPEDVFKVLSEQYSGEEFLNKERDVDLTQADIESPFSINILRKLKIMNDMSYDYDKIQSVIRLTEQAPKKWSDLQVSKLNLMLVEQNALPYIDTANFRTLPFIESAKSTIVASEAFYDRFSFEETKTGFDLKLEIETEWNIAEDKENILMQKRHLDAFSAAINTTALLMSRNRTEKFEVWGKAFVDSVKRFKEQKKSHPIIDLLQYNEDKNKVELREDLKRAEIPDYELEPMKAEFDRLEKSEDEKDKKFLKDFIDYNVFEFGLSSSKESGSYNVLFTDAMHMQIGNDMKEEKDRWKAGFDEKTFYAIQNEILAKNIVLANRKEKFNGKEKKIYEPLLNEKVVEEIGENAQTIGLTKKDKVSLNRYKEIIDLFKSNPELASIGSETEYENYLDTIFPNSKVKDILYHGTPGEKFNKFSDDFKNSNKGLNVGIWENKQQTFRNKAGIWLAASKFFAKVVFAETQGLYEGEGNVLPVIVNVNNIISKDLGEIEEKDLSNDAIKTTETVHLPDNIGGVDVSDIAYLITKSENTHILGSKQDIEEFKKFVEEIGEKEKARNEYNKNQQLQLELELFESETFGTEAEQKILRNGGFKTNSESYKRFGDWNNIKGNNKMILAYFKKSAPSLDQIAQEIDVEPQDLVDFMHNYPSGVGTKNSQSKDTFYGAHNPSLNKIIDPKSELTSKANKMSFDQLVEYLSNEENLSEGQKDALKDVNLKTLKLTHANFAMLKHIFCTK